MVKKQTSAEEIQRKADALWERAEKIENQVDALWDLALADGGLTEVLADDAKERKERAQQLREQASRYQQQANEVAKAEKKA